MENTDGKKSEVTLKCRTLSLNNNKSSQTNNSKNTGKVKVEFKHKRSSLNRSHFTNNKRSVNIGTTAKLTDDEFKARVKALQNATLQNVLNNEQKSLVEKGLQNPEQKPQVIMKEEKQKPEQLEKQNSVVTNNQNSTNDKKDTGLIDELIKMAPKNNNPKNSEAIKPVVFRSDAFTKKKKINEYTKRKNSDVRDTSNVKTHKVEDKFKNDRLQNSGKTARGYSRFRSQIEKKQTRTEYASTQSTNSNSLPRGSYNKENFVSPAPQTVSKFKNTKPTRKYKFSKDDGNDNYINKNNSSKFSKKDLALAMSDDEIGRGRSVASIKRAKQKYKNSNSSASKPVIREVNIPDSITVGELANRMAVKASEVVKYLLSVGTMATINQIIDGETAEIICTSFGHKVKRVSDEDFEQELDFSSLDTPERLSNRSPIVAVMGHVDHGKTTLLDTLRKTSITKKESGGITQHVAAYQVKTSSGKEITFIDTPGHAAFSNIRARGATLTDIIVLVVAADDGIKEQTIEVIKEASVQNVPLVVAINKIDKPGIDINRVKSELMQYDVLLEEFGGEVLCVEISAKNNTNLDKLLESILLQAEVLDLKANAERRANCTVLETRMEKGRGIVASVVVNGGTLKVGDVFVVGTTYGKVRTITDSWGERLKDCKPAMPVDITGFDKAPEPGDSLIVVETEQKAHEISEKRRELQKRKTATKLTIKNMADLMSETEKKVQNINMYIKADVYGSLEAIEASLLAINSSEVKITVIGKAIGTVNESDIDFAKASGAMVVCFNTTITSVAKAMAKTSGVKIISNDVIYHLVNSAIEMLEDMLPPIIEEKYIGRMLVKKLFFISRLGTIAGGVVTDGIIKKNNCKIQVIRNSKTIFEGTIKSMKHEKDEIKECGLNRECGILVDNFNDYNEGDYIECYEIVQKKRRIQ